MAVTTTKLPNTTIGITYSVITDSSSDWASVSNDVYFFDKATDLPYYKNSSGTVINVFEEGGSATLNDGEVFVGNASNEATSVPMSGDVAITNAGVTTVQPDSITYDKMQDTTQACMLGNQTGAGTVQEIPMVEAYIPAGATRTLLETTTNWDVNGVYTGTTITGTYQGQNHYNGNYWFTAVDDNVWIRLIRG